MQNYHVTLKFDAGLSAGSGQVPCPSTLDSEPFVHLAQQISFLIEDFWHGALQCDGGSQERPKSLG